MARIVYFSRDFTSHDWRFLDVLANSGHQVYYLRLERGEQIYEDRALPLGVEAISWKGGQKPVGQSELLELRDDLNRMIASIKPDLIHAGPIQSAALLVALNGFHPLVTMSWGYDLLLDAERNPFSKWATRYTLRRSDLVIGDCETVRLKVRSFGIPDRRIVTFPWGVDLQYFTPEEQSKAEGRFTYLSTRSWEPIYGVDVIANAFVKVVREKPDLHLVILGAGSMKENLHQILSGSDVKERVDFPGQISYSQLPDFYRRADIYLSASHSDGSSISLLEAMACGCPVLVSDIPGNREWVHPAENGWLFPDGDVDAMAEFMLRAENTRHQLKDMGRNARKLAEKRADWKVNSQVLLSAYQSVLTEMKN